MHVIRSIVRYLLILLGCLAVALVTAWGALAVWFRGPETELVQYALIGGYVCLGILAILSLVGIARGRWHAALAVAFVGLVGWWATLTPPGEGNWAGDVARQTTGVIDGDVLTVTDMRSFDWQGAYDAQEHWVTQSYDLSTVKSLDILLSYWAGPAMAHFITSFGFEDGRQLAWSIEVRRSVDGTYSPVGDAFKANPLVILAAAEDDVVGVRTRHRGEDVRLFRLATPPSQVRQLLEEYVADANRLAETPRWYNSLTTNCTTMVLKLIDAVGVQIPFDWRLLANGYLPEFMYERGALDSRHTIDALRAAGAIETRAAADVEGVTFSAAIRDGVPSPLDE